MTSDPADIAEVGQTEVQQPEEESSLVEAFKELEIKADDNLVLPIDEPNDLEEGPAQEDLYKD